jgi:hypothetical protein
VEKQKIYELGNEVVVNEELISNISRNISKGVVGANKVKGPPSSRHRQVPHGQQLP